MDASKIELKVFTLNCWGIPFLSKDVKNRMQAIAEVLVMNCYDIVCLQEVWTDRDYNLIKEKVSGVLPYSHYFYSGVIGSGICILSRYAMQDVFFHPWAVNGYVHKLQHGDWFGGKGIGLCRLKVNGYKINVYSAHLHAEYHRDCDEYLAHRVLQAFDTAQFIQVTSGGADLVILAGDLNTEPGDLAYRIILGLTGLTDAFLEAGENAQYGTNECFKNSYTNRSLRNICEGIRIDYIMYATQSNVKADLLKYSLPLPERVPDQSYSYSDHEAVSTVIRLSRCEACTPAFDLDSLRAILAECMDICDTALHRLVMQRRVFWIFTFILFGLLIATIVTQPPFGFTIIYHVLKVVLTGALCFTIIMGEVWNKIEKHAVRAGKLTMEVSLKQLAGRDVQ